MPTHVVGVCMCSLRFFSMWEPIVQLCVLDSVLAFWQTLRNFKLMTTILSHLGGVGRQDLQGYNNYVQYSLFQTILSEDEHRVRLVNDYQCGDGFFYFLYDNTCLWEIS